MDKERIKGKAEDIAGRAERQVGEWTGNEKAQAEGKARNAVGKMKDGVRDAANKLHDEKIRNEEERKKEEDRKIERDIDRDKNVA
jgi:uncharacterized protein YjbJ (UPF0337 family)